MGEVPLLRTADRTATKKTNLAGIDWVIVSGESGHKARPMKEDWVLDILDQCQVADVKFFFMQWCATKRSLGGSSWIRLG